MSEAQEFDSGMTVGESADVEEADIQISRLKEAVAALPSHRNYSVAITKLDEARLWLRDRQHQPPSPKRPG